MVKGRSSLIQRRRALLSDDVRQRMAIGRLGSASETPLPLERRAPGSPPQGAAAEAASTGSAVVQKAGDGAGSPGSARGSTPDGSEGGEGTTARPSAEQVADRVYELMRQDLRLERERIRW